MGHDIWTLRLRAASLAAVLSALLVVACSGSTEPTPTPISITDLASPEEALRERAEVATTLWNDSDWLGFYEFKSPRSVEPRWPYGLPAVQFCTKEQFVIDAGKKLALLRADTGLDQDATLSWTLKSVSVDGVQGGAELDILHDGGPLETDYNDYLGVSTTTARWIFDGGQWWLEDENWKDGCHDTGIFGG